VRFDAVVIAGPTGAGKTDLALELGSRLPVEIVSVDSAMVYRGLDIGTGKPSRAELAHVPHHLIDILDPREAYSAGRFVTDAVTLTEAIRARGRLPLLVGGTMLYLRALTHGLAPLPAADAQVRARIDAEAAQIGWPRMHDKLEEIDPLAAQRIRPNDAQRIQRALEVHEVTGRTLTELHAAGAERAPRLRLRRFAWCPGDREQLYRRIERRFDAMLEAGLVDEVRALHARGDLSERLPSVRSVGYRQLWRHFEGQCSLAEAMGAVVTATRQLARRQLTWLRSDGGLEWVDSLESGAGVRMLGRLTESLGTPRGGRP
jgi:tRNA dimethylallyltransferase